MKPGAERKGYILMTFFDVLTLIGGLFLFLFGTSVMSTVEAVGRK